MTQLYHSSAYGQWIQQSTSQILAQIQFIPVPFTIVKKWKQLKHSSTDKWIIKVWYIYIMGHYSTVNKNKVMKSAGR